MKNDDLPLSNMANTETNVCYKILRAGYCLLVVTQENVFSRCTMTKEYFSISHLPNFFLTVQNKCILLCLNGMSKAAIPRSNTVHFFSALVHQSALFRCTAITKKKTKRKEIEKKGKEAKRKSCSRRIRTRYLRHAGPAFVTTRPRGPHWRKCWILLNPFPHNFRQRYLYIVDRAVLNMNSKIFFRRITGVWTVKSQRKPNFKADTV